MKVRFKKRTSKGTQVPKDGGTKNKLKNIVDEFKNIRTVELASIKSFFLEKIFWTFLGLIGIAWAFYFVPSNFQIWSENPSIKMEGDLTLSQLKYPAISITPSGSTKYAIAERLGNYLEPKKLPKNFRLVRNLLLKCAVVYKGEIEGRVTRAIDDRTYYDEYLSQCMGYYLKFD